MEKRVDRITNDFLRQEVEPGVAYKYRVEIEGKTGQRMLLFETEVISTPPLPVTLFQNVPNPFNPTTTIRYYLPEAAPVTLDIYDISGRRVTRLVDKVQEKGFHTVEWNGMDAKGISVASGVYFYRLVTGKETISRKMVLLK